MIKKYGKNEITRKMFSVLNKYKESKIASFDAIFLLEPLFKAKEIKITNFYQRENMKNKPKEEKITKIKKHFNCENCGEDNEVVIFIDNEFDQKLKEQR